MKTRCVVRARVPVKNQDAYVHYYVTSKDENPFGSKDLDGSSPRALVFGQEFRPASLDSREDLRGCDRTTFGASCDYELPTNHASFVIPKSELQVPIVRLHSQCFTGEAFCSNRCDCAFQLETSISMIAASKEPGVVIYMMQEGRSIGMIDKLRAYNLQDLGSDTVSANRELGLPVDARQYQEAADILKDLGITTIRLLTNNPEKVEKLQELGINVLERLPIVFPDWRKTCNDLKDYMESKVELMQHLL